MVCRMDPSSRFGHHKTYPNYLRMPYHYLPVWEVMVDGIAVSEALWGRVSVATDGSVVLEYCHRFRVMIWVSVVGGVI